MKSDYRENHLSTFSHVQHFESVFAKEDFNILLDLVLKEGKVYVPKNEELRAEIIQLYHDTLVVRHGGKWKMMELVTRNYW